MFDSIVIYWNETKKEYVMSILATDSKLQIFKEPKFNTILEILDSAEMKCSQVQEPK